MYRVVRIEKVVQETPSIKSFYFVDNSNPAPGQFYMVWIPGVDEFPMSISAIDDLKRFTVKKIGDGTAAMHNLQEGDRLWIRGPYGRGFKPTDEPALVVGGGTGMATLAPLINALRDADVIIAARNEKELLFVDEFPDKEVHIATDDGSRGFKGFASELAAVLIDKKEYGMVYTCGPEPMIKAIVDICLARKIPVQASLERFMKCGIGVCDSCSINGFRVCADGPVFSEKELAQMTELGKWKRDPSGMKVKI